MKQIAPAFDTAVFRVVRLRVASRFFSTQMLAGLLALIGLAGLIDIPIPSTPMPELREFHQSISPELIGIGITVLIIESANERRATAQYKRQLIRRMASKYNQIASQAVDELRLEGWITDGTLSHQSYYGANLEGVHLLGKTEDEMLDWFEGNRNLKPRDIGAVLKGAKLGAANLKNSWLTLAQLQGAVLFGANLEGASLGGANMQNANLNEVVNLTHTDLQEANLRGCKGLSEKKLVRARNLRGAIMPDGSRYDGRYRLYGDLNDFKDWTSDPPGDKNLAAFYGVSLAEYQKGQAWADANLKSLRDDENLKEP